MSGRTDEKHGSFIGAVICLFVGLVPAAMCSSLRLNEAQVVGTHNSYHQAPPEEIQNLAYNPLVDAVAGSYAQSAVNTTQYSHLNFYEQLELGLRSLEIDLFPDPTGGTYDQSVLLRLAGTDGWMNNSALQPPGFKVLHEPDVDFGSSCFNFSNCLGLIADWHAANPGHFPLTIFLNQKVSGLAEFLGNEGNNLLSAVMQTSSTPGPDTYVTVPVFDDASYDQIEAEVLQFFNMTEIVTPDEVRGNYSTLSDAVLANSSGPGWPSLDTLWGRLLLVWTPESFNDYLALHPNLEGALCFVSSVDGNSGDSGGKTVTDPAGVFIQTYDSLSWSSPVKASELRSFTTRAAQSHRRTLEIVEAGYMAISFTDEDCNEARYNFTTRRDALVSAGAQIIKTDFPTPPTFFPSNYSMAPFSSTTGARCNPVLTQNSTTAAGDGNTAAASCTAADLSDTSAQMATAG